ncbi:arginine--tRNA ligase [Candidatus Saccharibacteria bacterium CPR2]|nr:arginine--tRNA ligase [Candidatus Saccharibacteria bacterium CPR2]
MQYYLAKLQEEVKRSVAGLVSLNVDDIHIEAPGSKIEADLAIPCFTLAQKLNQSPKDIADKLASALKNEAIEKTESTNGYLNVWIKSTALAKGIENDSAQVKQNNIQYGESKLGTDKVVVVDFASPNVAKPFSVGHLRSTNIGWAIIQLLKNWGYKVIGDNHLGDTGTPFGMWVVGFQKWGSEEALEKNGVYELGRIYVKFREEAKKEELNDKNELIASAKEWVKKLESGDETALSYHKKFSDISYRHIQEIFDRLGVKPDENLGESFYLEKAKEITSQLVQKNIAQKQEDGSVIVDLSDAGIETPILLQKSDGASLYATTDIATIDYRVEKWKPEKIIYVVGQEQQFHFKQLFALAKKLGYETEFIHVWYGLVQQKNESGGREKMSSRKGTILLEELLDMAEEKARSIALKTHVSDEDIKKVAIGAVKFTDFSQNKHANILFDWDRMFNLHGYSGPYVQYAAVRVNSILGKIGEEKLDFAASDYSWKSEKDLLKQIAKYPLVLESAAKNYEPHEVAYFIYDLAKICNRYYEEVSIIDSEPNIKSLRIGLLYLIKYIYSHALGILGIAVPSKM